MFVVKNSEKRDNQTFLIAHKYKVTILNYKKKVFREKELCISQRSPCYYSFANHERRLKKCLFE